MFCDMHHHMHYRYQVFPPLPWNTARIVLIGSLLNITEEESESHLLFFERH